MTVEELMKTLNCSEEEAKDIIETDKAIDRGADPFPLTPEQEAVEKKMRQADRKKEKVPRKVERKANADKREIMQVLDDALCDLVDDVTLVNVERQIDFIYNDVKYRIILSVPRK